MNIDSVTLILFVILLICILGGLAILFWFYRLIHKKTVENRVITFVDVNIGQNLLASTDGSVIQQGPGGGYSDVRKRINQSLAFLSTDKMRKKIISAYWPMTDIEFIFLRIMVGLAGLFLGWLITRSLLGGLGLGLLLFIIPAFVLDRSLVNRRKKFQNQLVDFLVLIQGAISIGNSLLQALDMAVVESGSPINEEFQQVLREINFGITLEESLSNLHMRMQGDDLQIVITAIIINHQIGGNLSTLLEATIDTIRDRIRLFSEIRSLTSYSRFVARAITILPFLAALGMFLINPHFFDTAKTSTQVRGILIFAAIGVILGNIVMRRLMKVRF